MGESIYIILTLLDGNLPESWQRTVANELSQLSSCDRERFVLDTTTQTITSTEGIKWHSFETDMRRLSEIYTPLRMELMVEHESGAQTLIYAYGGEIQTEPGRVEFGPCTLWS